MAVKHFLLRYMVQLCTSHQENSSESAGKFADIHEYCTVKCTCFHLSSTPSPRCVYNFSLNINVQTAYIATNEPHETLMNLNASLLNRVRRIMKM